MSNGLKTFFKVLYICAGVVVLIFVYLLAYNNYTLTRIQGLASQAIAEKNYVELERIFGSFFSTESIVENNSSDYEIAVFPTAAFSTYKYKVNDEEKTYEHSDRGYNIYFIKPDKNSVNDVTKGTSLSNETGIKYTFTDGIEYTYHLQISETYNKSEYISEPRTANESILHGARNYFSIYSYLNYFDIQLTESIVDAIKAETGSTGTVNKITFVDASGKDVGVGHTVTLDFGQEWFNEVDEYITKYNQYITDYNAAEDNETKSNLTKEFETYFYGSNNDGYYYTFQNRPGCGVARGKDYVYPGSLIWQSVGMCALVVVVLFLLYMLIFHFKFLKNLVYRVGHRQENLGRAGLSAKEKKNLVKADYSELQRRNKQASLAATSKINNEEAKPEEKEEKKDE